jgi:phosphoribosyl 1,2-cyclic phosphodiesterase
MQLQIINSNSSGNAYLLENDKEALLIECGVRFDRIKKALNFNMRKLTGALITHEHLDHCISAKDLIHHGVNVYATKGTHHAMRTLQHHRAVVTHAGDEFKVGNFRVKAFDIRHDAAEPVGYLINHAETGTVLFLTDSYYSNYLFPGLSNIIIEANYSSDIIHETLEDKKFLRDRVIESHMSLNTCKELLKANNLAGVNNIVLIHLSDSNSNAIRFKKEIEEVTGKTVHVAESGMIIENFNQTPF